MRVLSWLSYGWSIMMLVLALLLLKEGLTEHSPDLVVTALLLASLAITAWVVERRELTRVRIIPILLVVAGLISALLGLVAILDSFKSGHPRYPEGMLFIPIHITIMLGITGVCGIGITTAHLMRFYKLIRKRVRS